MPYITEGWDGVRMHRQCRERPLTSFARCPRSENWLLADLGEERAGTATSLQAQNRWAKAKGRRLQRLAQASGHTWKQHTNAWSNTGEALSRKVDRKRAVWPHLFIVPMSSACVRNDEFCSLEELDPLVLTSAEQHDLQHHFVTFLHADSHFLKAVQNCLLALQIDWNSIRPGQTMSHTAILNVWSVKTSEFNKNTFQIVSPMKQLLKLLIINWNAAVDATVNFVWKGFYYLK